LCRGHTACTPRSFYLDADSRQPSICVSHICHLHWLRRILTMILRCFVRMVFLLLLLPSVGLTQVQLYLQVNGSEADAFAVKLDRTASEITATFQAPHDGTYSFGVAISASEVLPLSPEMKQYNCASVSQPVVLHYPYDWSVLDFSNDVTRTKSRL